LKNCVFKIFTQILYFKRVPDIPAHYWLFWDQLGQCFLFGKVIDLDLRSWFWKNIKINLLKILMIQNLLSLIEALFQLKKSLQNWRIKWRKSEPNNLGLQIILKNRFLLFSFLLLIEKQLYFQEWKLKNISINIKIK